MIKLFNHFELLSEARNWDDVKEYYMAKKSADGVPMDDDLGLKIVDADPTENKMYVKWLILKPFTNMDIYGFTKGLEEVKGMLSIYDRAKSILPQEQRDIMSCCKNFDDLKAIVLPYIEDPTLLLSKNQLRGDTPVSGQYEVIYDDAEWTVIVPKTHSASCYWGSGSKWCTAYDKNPRWFEDYVKMGILFIFRNKANKDSRYQLHVPKIEFKNKTNIDWDLGFFEEHVNLLLSVLQYLKLNKKNKGIEILFVELIKNKCYTCVEAFLKNGVNPDAMGKDRTNALYSAIYKSDIRIIDLLLDAGANPLFSIKGKSDNYTPIVDAINIAHLNPEKKKIIFDKLLNSMFIDINKKYGTKKKTGIILSIDVAFDLYNQYEIDIIKLFLDNGADPNIQDKDGNDFFHNLMLSKDLYAMYFHKVGNIMEYLGYIKNPNQKNKEGLTYLHILCQWFGRSDSFLTMISKKLIELGADISITDSQNITAFEYLPYDRKQKYLYLKPETINYDEKEALGEILKEKYKITDYKIHDDFTVDVHGSVNFSWLALTSIPFNFGIVYGDFDCRYNRLEDLKGAPKEVKGNFYCFRNNLTSLLGSPEIVGGDFDCSGNNLKNLEHSTKVVGGQYDCSNNSLTTLKGAPETIQNNFVCKMNKLESVKDLPKTIKETLILDKEVYEKEKEWIENNISVKNITPFTS